MAKRLDSVNAAWDQLVGQIGEREESLNNVLDATSQFHETLLALSNWIPVIGDSVDGLATQSPTEQRELIKVELLLYRKIIRGKVATQLTLRQCFYLFARKLSKH